LSQGFILIDPKENIATLLDESYADKNTHRIKEWLKKNNFTG